jgi:signal transduction histidine kinase
MRNRALILAFVAVVAVIGGNLYLSFRSIRVITSDSAWVSHTNEVIAHINALESSLQASQTGVRGYIITRDKSLLQPYEGGRRSAPQEVETLTFLTRDNPREQARAARLKSLVRDFLKLEAEKVASAGGPGGQNREWALVHQGTESMAALTSILDEMEAEEQGLLQQRTAEVARSTARASFGLSLVTGIAMVLTVGVLWVGVRSFRRQENDAEKIRRLLAQVQQRAEELDRKVLERTHDLQQTNEALEAFSYSVSHDLRAPLRGIAGLANALQEDYAGELDDTGQRFLTGMKDSAKRMDALIENLLAYSRLARRDFVAQPVDLREAFHDACNQVAADIQRTRAQIQLPSEYPVVVGNRVMLTQIVANLLSNAIKYVPPGKQPKVEVWTQQQDGKARVVFCDNGIGVAPQDQERIFAPFERLHGAERYSGSGIGLAIVKKGVERMNGRTGVESQVGKGSKFWIELPKAS